MSKSKPRGKSRTIMLAAPRTCDECGAPLTVPYVTGMVKRCAVCEVRRLATLAARPEARAA